MPMTHFGDPCIHCDTPHDDVPVGPCMGDLRKVRPVRFRSLGVRWDNVEHFLVLMSDGSFEDRWHHISENAPYYHFGYSAFGSPPEYDQNLRRPARA